ncbi:MAG: histidine kinase [Bacteroidota bacterium]|nr:histidine kinase [Bacteroidota bacterium]
MENQEISGVTEFVALGSLGMIVLIVFIFLFIIMYQKKMNTHALQINEKETNHQKELLGSTIMVEEKERERIAKNLHDDIGTNLNVLKLQLTKISRNPADKELVAELLHESKAMLENTIQQVRGISKDLMPPVLMNLGFEKALSELCRNINNSNSIYVDFTTMSEGRTPDQKIILQLYRIVNEVVNNIIKHANATHISMKLSAQGNSYTVLVAHNGNGINDQDIKKLSGEGKGVGLKSILSRVQVVNGRIEYSTHEKNSEIKIEVPLKESKQ